MRVETDFFFNHQDPGDVGDVNRLNIVGIIDEVWLGRSLSAVTVSYLPGHAYHVGLLVSLCAIHPLHDEVPSNKTFRSGSLEGYKKIRDALSEG